MLLSAAPVAATSSPAVQAVQAVQAAAGLTPPAADAIRFTAIQPDGRGAIIFEAGRGAKGTMRTTVDLTPTPGGGWTVAARETKPLAAETFAYFRELIEGAIRAGDGAPCAEGPDYRAELGAAGVSGCGGDGPVPALARGLGLADPVTP